MKFSCKSSVTPTASLVLLLSVGNLSAEVAKSPAATARSTNEAIADEAPRTHEWSYLAPDNGRPFHDPFSKLTSNQIADLSYVARVQRLISEEKISTDGADAKEAAGLARQLGKQGVDVGWLLVQRERVRQIRSLQVEGLSKSIAKSLQDKRVALAGYVIPVKVDEGQLTEFFLVPTIAACSHEDAPPRLQVVFVATEQGIATPGRRTPVRVTGKVVAETTTRTTFNGNGRVQVHSAYAMSSPEIRVFQATRKSSNPTKQ